ncbi:MAG TPA: PfkB family carbohydrate kinase, partial [Candidatus Krumholzibacterium sp.]|nr:PfkB family carbohydrate kinase [Candidatus Krumholzibacterium sp.]
GDKEMEKEHIDRLFSVFESRLAGADAVILSDYDQGVFSSGMIRRSVSACRRAGIPVVADSRFRIENFQGVTTATPNEVEAARAVGVRLGGEKELQATGSRLLRRLRSDSILVTRGRFGMSLFARGRRRVDAQVVGSPEATDVTGAGDTVVAAVALSLAAGLDMKVAMALANMAASIVVMKRGTAVAGPDELAGVIERECQAV